MKNQNALILIGFLAIGAACGCGAHDGSPTETGSNDVTDTTATDSCCDGVEAHTDAARSVSPSGSDDAPGIATVYVSPRGSDTAPGTHDAPVLTLAHAIRLAAERGHSVAVRP